MKKAAFAKLKVGDWIKPNFHSHACQIVATTEFRLHNGARASDPSTWTKIRAPRKAKRAK